MSFDWQTEEDFSWDDEPVVEESKPRRPRRWRPFAAIIVVLAILGATGWYILRQVGDRVEEVSADVEDDVLASHNLVRLAAEQKDAELLTTVLSGRDPSWSRAQEQLIADGLLFDYPALGLQMLPSASEVISVTLAPDLASAEVSSTESYAVSVGNGVSETVEFERHAIYRLGESTWLYAPPVSNAEFWGGWVDNNGAWMSLIVSERDAEVGRRLARDLEGMIGEVCFGLSDVVCPAGYHLEITLERDPDSLQLDYYNDLLAFTGDSISLPSPTLIGVPTDEASYEALFRGYASYVVSMMLMELSGWECCEQGLFYQALLSKQLEQLGLQPWPLTQGDYEELYSASTQLELQFSLWNAPVFEAEAEGSVTAFAVVDYLSDQNPGRDAYTMIQALDTADSYWDWVLLFVGDEADTATLERDWQRFVYNQSRPVISAPPYPLPREQALVMCNDAQPLQNDLYRYDFRNNTLIQESLGEQYVSLLQLPNSELLLMQTGETLENLRLSRWQAGEITPFWIPDFDNRLFNVSYDEVTGMLGVILQDNTNTPAYFVFDVANCPDTGACEPVQMTGWPIFSPDRENILFVLDNPVTTPAGLQSLALQSTNDDQTLIPFASNTGNPLWLDNQTVAYLRYNETGTPSIVTQAITASGDSATVLATLADLQATLPITTSEVTSYELNRMFAHPAHPQTLFIDLSAPDSAFTLQFNVHALTSQVVIESDAINSRPQLSPDGNYLFANLGDTVLLGSGRLLMHNLAQGVSQQLPLSDWNYNLAWTADNRWMLKVDGNVLTLLAPDLSYEQTLIHDLNCFPAGWAQP